MISNVRGEFGKYRGTVTYDAARPEATRIEAALVDNLSDLDAEVERKIDLDRRIQDLEQEMRQLRERVYALESSHAAGEEIGRLQGALSAAVATGPATSRLLDDELAVQDWLSRSDELLSLLLTAADAQNRGALDSIRVQLAEVFDRITTAGAHLPGDERTAAAGIVSELGTLGLDGTGLLETRAQQLDTAYSEGQALARNKLLADQLNAAVSVPLRRLSEAALDLGSATSEQANDTARRLIALVVVGFFAAAVILAYISRSVIRRLYRLQLSMRDRQAGLNTPIDTRGGDEIAEMSRALDFFVRTISQREAETERALVELQATQVSLVQAEKLASLGQLTAGVAHEIKNPLNFVNNFAALSLELCDELQTSARGGDKTEVDETLRLLTGNLAKIRDHGKRADGIVRSMLQHSRDSTGETQIVDFNALVDEAVTLAYTGARTQNAHFAVLLERRLTPDLGDAELIPAEITRVILNLLANAFYAAESRPARPGEAKVVVSTIGNEDNVEVLVADNGTGISPEIQKRLFTPFFTTKPTGEGTGLGLSLSYDIVARKHHGRIGVESVPGRHTVFTVVLPRRHRAETPRPAAALSAD